MERSEAVTHRCGQGGGSRRQFLLAPSAQPAYAWLMRLLTIPISHYVEKARWALDYAKIAFREEGHAQILHYRATLPHGSRTVPVLIDGTSVIADSTAILLHVDALAAADRKLYPLDPAQRKQVLDWEDEFDLRLGPHVRRVGYHRAFAMGKELTEPLRGRVPDWELTALQAAFPLAVALMRKGMNINAKKADESLLRVRSQCDAVAKALDGKDYLVGDHFSAADLTFAALLAPVLVLPQHPVRLDLLQLPDDFKALQTEFAAHPAGLYAQRLYARHRQG
ncbi:MAG: glutathione S-transferase family protein [Myxococcales bacterium]|nr:glutathione S-transferase family protein [Myxococcales bacterium]